MNLPSSMLEFLSFFGFLDPDALELDGGGEGVSSLAACAGVNNGAATSAIENIARVKILIANLLIHRS
jgi:hypothetical protein